MNPRLRTSSNANELSLNPIFMAPTHLNTLVSNDSQATVLQRRIGGGHLWRAATATWRVQASRAGGLACEYGVTARGRLRRKPLRARSAWRPEKESSGGV